MRFGTRYDKKKGPKRPFKKSGKSEDASAVVYQVYTVSSDESVTHYLYSVAEKTRAEGWILDPGASTHITGDEKMLSDCKPMKEITVTLANGDRPTAAVSWCERNSYPYRSTVRSWAT